MNVSNFKDLAREQLLKEEPRTESGSDCGTSHFSLRSQYIHSSGRWQQGSHRGGTDLRKGKKSEDLLDMS